MPTLTLEPVPSLGQTVSLQLSNSSGSTSAGVLFTGLSQGRFPTAWGGELLVEPSYVTALTIPGVGLDLVVDLPETRTLEGLTVYLQALQFDLGATNSVSFTAGLAATFGW